jgi:nucleoid-associated protein YgaU
VFARGSRYEKVVDAVYEPAPGQSIPFKRLRIFPLPAALQAYTVTRGDRLDLIAYRFYRDPQQFWRIADANLTMLPEDLMSEAGRRLAIPGTQE